MNESFWQRRWKIIVIILSVIAILAILGYILKITVKPKRNAGSSNPQEKIIVSNLVDLGQIKAISYFRSCAGHLYGETNIQNEKESSCSLKHYFVPQEELSPSQNKVKILAPFDGEVVDFETHTQRGQGIIISPSSSPDWTITIFHITLVQGLEKNKKIASGELLGHATLENQGDSFDFALNFGSESFTFLDSIFNHMNDRVAAEYQKYGVTPEIMIIPKETRDKSPCPCREGEAGTTSCNFFDNPDYFQENYISLTPPL